jgi:hypothetical protein
MLCLVFQFDRDVSYDDGEGALASSFLPLLPDFLATVLATMASTSFSHSSSSHNVLLRAFWMSTRPSKLAQFFLSSFNYAGAKSITRCQGPTPEDHPAETSPGSISKSNSTFNPHHVKPRGLTPW